MDLRTLGKTEIQVTSVAMGCWPIAGMTSLNVNEADSLDTLRAAVESGIQFFDTAYCYGPNGESERLIAAALGDRRDEIVIATKGGLHWDPAGNRIFDASPARLLHECEQSLVRLNTDRVDLLYVHAPDPSIPVSESAGAMLSLIEQGKTRSVGVSNFSLEQLIEFHSVCPITAVQPPYNMLQRDIEQEMLPWCQKNDVSAIVYWPLMKGLLAGKLPRNHVFGPGDGRPKYPMFQGEQWQKNQDLLDDLRGIADGLGRTVAQLVISWTVHQPGITSALCGAKRRYQIEETASAMDWIIDPHTIDLISEALARRGTPVSKPAV